MKNNSFPLIAINAITKTYTHNNQSYNALDGVSLTIAPGEIFCLLGVNGAGKTTLSSIIATVHPPTSGDIVFKGRSIYARLSDYRAVLGFCPQHQNLDLELTVEENLIFAGRYLLMPEEVIAQRVQDLMTQFEINRYAAAPIQSLSGGTKQRVLIVRALMNNPEIVILDEPTVGLDPDIRRKLWEHIKQLKKMGITVIITTHYLDEAEALSDRICILNKGKILLIESMESLKARHDMAKLEDIFLKLLHDEQALTR